MVVTSSVDDAGDLLIVLPVKVDGCGGVVGMCWVLFIYFS